MERMVSSGGRNRGLLELHETEPATFMGRQIDARSRILLNVLSEAERALEAGASKGEAKHKAIAFGKRVTFTNFNERRNSTNNKIAASVELCKRDRNFAEEVLLGFIEARDSVAESYGLEKDNDGKYKQTTRTVIQACVDFTPKHPGIRGE